MNHKITTIIKLKMFMQIHEPNLNIMMKNVKCKHTQTHTFYSKTNKSAIAVTMYRVTHKLFNTSKQRLPNSCCHQYIHVYNNSNDRTIPDCISYHLYELWV